MHAWVRSRGRPGKQAERAWRLRYLRERSMMLLVTSNCSMNDRGVEDAAVDEALSTLAAARDDGA